MLIALYEHRSDHTTSEDSNGGEYGRTADDQGGARSLAASGLKWLLRFIHSLVAGAPNVLVANNCATTGIPYQTRQGQGVQTIDEMVASSVSGMLRNLPELWPKPREHTESPDKGNAKNKAVGKAAQQRAMEKMKQRQTAFSESAFSDTETKLNELQPDDQEADLCIICRCDDVDVENNGPLGYLGHVQRSRLLTMISSTDSSNNETSCLDNMYQVVGHMGCQVCF